MATTYDLSIHAGETRTLAVTVTDQDGAAVDLTDASISYVLDRATQIVLTVGDGITITDAAAGQFEIALAQAYTSDINVATRVAHECKALLQSGEVLTVFYGSLRIKDSLIDTMS